MICFFNAPSTPDIYTLSLHDALPIYLPPGANQQLVARADHVVTGDGNVLDRCEGGGRGLEKDRKSTRLNSSHRCISYAVFCLKKKNKRIEHTNDRNIHTDHSLTRARG